MPRVTSKSAEGTIEYQGIRYMWSEQGWFVLGHYSKATSEVEEQLNSIARQLDRHDSYRWCFPVGVLDTDHCGKHAGELVS